MTVPLLVFFVVAALAVLSAIGLIVRKNPIHAALFLVVNLFCVAVLYLQLQAEFLAAAQVIIYAGAIMVLFLFALMVLVPGREEMGPDPRRAQRMEAIGRMLFTDYLFPFEVTSILLLAAIVGAMVLAKRKVQ
jgi:NADH-quinone oxidoreductase subunit J